MGEPAKGASGVLMAYADEAGGVGGFGGLNAGEKSAKTVSNRCFFGGFILTKQKPGRKHELKSALFFGG